MARETNGPNEQEVRMVALEHKFNDLLAFVHMIVPHMVKAPKLEKYNGRGDLMIHLQMYCWKMAQYANNEPLMIQTF